ncbi:MFS transporter [Pedobacter chitinilyticus]|uniref:MFS transporter n=1 Tax=Pedobacter chitinilyticus TaxID=2233776 RepID=A0A3S3QEN9_9SPHI|nr:MFS transporter [Pedobacter chitinilyticus]RWU05596.1 MFS transporter [Pedobacter chitinilyticus]
MFSRILNAYKTSFSGLSRQTWILSLVILVNRCGFMAVPFMGLYVTQALHRPESDAGIIISLFGFGSILGAAAGGKLTDVFGYRPVQILASLIGGLFFLMFAMVEDFTLLCGLAVVISFFSEAFRPANYAAIASYAAEGTETRSYSLNRLANNIGWAFGISMGGIIASYNYKLLFIVDGSVSVLVAIVIFLLLPAKNIQHKTAQEKGEMSARKPWQDALYIKFLILCAMFTTCAFLMFRVVPVFYKEVWHLNEALIGIILGINGVVIALVEMVMISKIENKRSPIFYIVVGVIIVCFSFGVLMLPKVFPIALAVISILLFTFGEMLSLPFFNTFVVKRSNEYNRGIYAAGYTLSWSVAQVIGPTSGFYIAEKFGYNVLWIAITVLLLVCAYFFSKLKLTEE